MGSLRKNNSKEVENQKQLSGEELDMDALENVSGGKWELREYRVDSPVGPLSCGLYYAYDPETGRRGKAKSRMRANIEVLDRNRQDYPNQ